MYKVARSVFATSFTSGFESFAEFIPGLWPYRLEVAFPARSSGPRAGRKAPGVSAPPPRCSQGDRLSLADEFQAHIVPIAPRRHTSSVLAPISSSRSTPMICSSLKRLSTIRKSSKATRVNCERLFD